MLAELNNYIAGRYGLIKMDGEPRPVYGPDAFRDLGETAYPCFVVDLIDLDIDQRLNRPHIEVFEPSAEQATVQLSGQFAQLLRAQVCGSNAGPFAVVMDECDRLSFRTGHDGAWGDVQTVPFIDGSRDAWEVARSCNYWANGIVATAIAGRLWLETAEPATDLEILDVEHSAHEVLGLTPGVQSYLTRTGPASYTVRKYPTPVILKYQTEILATKRDQYLGLMPLFVNALPDGHWPRVGGQAPHFEFVGGQNLDGLDKPEWRTAFRYDVSQVWLDALTAYQVASILAVEAEFTA